MIMHQWCTMCRRAWREGGGETLTRTAEACLTEQAPGEEEDSNKVLAVAPRERRPVLSCRYSPSAGRDNLNLRPLSCNRFLLFLLFCCPSPRVTFALSLSLYLFVFPANWPVHTREEEEGRTKQQAKAQQSIYLYCLLLGNT
jgi:hypothetical protein